jgi:hypothetical protein
MGTKITTLEISLNTQVLLSVRLCAEAVAFPQKCLDKSVQRMEPEDGYMIVKTHCPAN